MDEVWIISYPKSGRTWLRVLLGKALCDWRALDESVLLNTEHVCAAAGLARTQFTHDGSEMRLGLRYTELEADKSAYRDKKVVLLVRDVKDTLTSAYFQATRRLGVFQGPISEFIRSDVYGSRKLLTFYQQWFQARETPKELLVIRYEQIHEDALSILRFVIEFIGFVAVPQEILESAVAFSGFRNLRQMEAQNHFRSSVLAPGDPADPQSFKLRQGKLGSYREHFSDSDISYVDSEIARFGCAFTIPERHWEPCG